MSSLLHCTLHPGQFQSELGVVVRSFQDRTYSLFADKMDLIYDSEPTRDVPVEGWLRVDIIDRQNEKFLVRLPQTTLENGQYLTVKAGQLKSPVEAKQPA